MKIILIILALLSMIALGISLYIEHRQRKEIVRRIKARGCRTYRLNKDGEYELVSDTTKPPTVEEMSYAKN